MGVQRVEAPAQRRRRGDGSGVRTGWCSRRVRCTRAPERSGRRSRPWASKRASASSASTRARRRCIGRATARPARRTRSSARRSDAIAPASTRHCTAPSIVGAQPQFGVRRRRRRDDRHHARASAHGGCVRRRVRRAARSRRVRSESTTIDVAAEHRVASERRRVRALVDDEQPCALARHAVRCPRSGAGPTRASHSAGVVELGERRAGSRARPTRASIACGPPTAIDAAHELLADLVLPHLLLEPEQLVQQRRRGRRCLPALCAARATCAPARRRASRPRSSITTLPCPSSNDISACTWPSTPRCSAEANSADQAAFVERVATGAHLVDRVR